MEHDLLNRGVCEVLKACVRGDALVDRVSLAGAIVGGGGHQQGSCCARHWKQNVASEELHSKRRTNVHDRSLWVLCCKRQVGTVMVE